MACMIRTNSGVLTRPRALHGWYYALASVFLGMISCRAGVQDQGDANLRALDAPDSIRGVLETEWGEPECPLTPIDVQQGVMSPRGQWYYGPGGGGSNRVSSLIAETGESGELWLRVAGPDPGYIVTLVVRRSSSTLSSAACVFYINDVETPTAPAVGCWESLRGVVYIDRSPWPPVTPFSIAYSLSGKRVGARERELLQGDFLIENFGN